MRTIPSFVVTALAASMLCSAQTAPTRSSAAKHANPAAPTIPKPIAGTPDIVFINGVIYTGVGFAEDKPQIVEAIAIGGGKVLAIGETEDIKHLAGPEDRAARSSLHQHQHFHLPGLQ